MSKANEYLPIFAQGETVEVMDTKLADGQTSPPDYLTESELIELMVCWNYKRYKKQRLKAHIKHSIGKEWYWYRCLHPDSHQQYLSKKLCTSSGLVSQAGSHKPWNCINPWVSILSDLIHCFSFNNC